MTIEEAAQNEDGFVFFFDIDNCLYRKSTKIHDLMQVSIHNYFVNHLELDDEQANELHKRYYTEFGLAIEGLVRFHEIDALEYNRDVDDALPLQDILKPDPELRSMLLSIDRTKVKKLWLFTNAYVNHGLRVVKLLGIEDLFDGITFCDYAEYPLVCKPKKEMYDKAMKHAGVTDPKKCLYVDDSYINIVAAEKLGWKEAIHFVEDNESMPVVPAGTHVIRDILDLPNVIPEYFQATS
ncbi:suppressor of disruption of TFIIS [Trichomonascus vanleenenianus]|uniref:suppressor of disruption of TFIIS n=1 Tax=Trichomonascus vanleenenianus TaxID=2268995 RepID=UPI003ECA4308